MPPTNSECNFGQSPPLRRILAWFKADHNPTGPIDEGPAHVDVLQQHNLAANLELQRRRSLTSLEGTHKPNINGAMVCYHLPNPPPGSFFLEFV